MLRLSCRVELRFQGWTLGWMGFLVQGYWVMNVLLGD